MPLCFTARHTFLHISDVEEKYDETQKRSASVPAYAQKENLKNTLFSAQSSYAEFLTKVEKAGGFLKHPWHQDSNEDNNEDNKTIKSMGMSPLKSSSPCKHLNDGQTSGSCTSVSPEGVGFATDVPEHLKTMQGCLALMVCNLPCAVTCEGLAAAVDSKGFNGKYDLIHLPGFRKTSNLGFGFIQFRKQEDAVEFAKAFYGYQFKGNSTKVIQIKPAHFKQVVRIRKEISKKQNGAKCTNLSP